MSAPFEITVWDKTFHRVGFVGNPTSVELHPRHNAQPTGTLEVPSNHQYLPQLLTRGARVTVDDGDDEQVLSGRIVRRAGTSDPGGTVSLELVDSWELLTTLLGWQVPTAAVTAQGTAEYDVKTGPAETVLKWFVSRAVTRLGLPVTVAPDLGRGATITVRMRMHQLADRLLPAVDQAGIGVTVRQVDTGTPGLVVDCYTPRSYPLALTPDSGIVTSWAWEDADPVATRVVVGGKGEKLARTFRGRVNTAAEADLGWVLERFLDATDVDTDAELYARADEFLFENGATSGLTLGLAETDSFRYGAAGSVRVGDLVPLQLIPGAPPITDVLREAVLKWDAPSGYTATPVVGERRDDPTRTLARYVAALGRAVRIQQAGR